MRKYEGETEENSEADSCVSCLGDGTAWAEIGNPSRGDLGLYFAWFQCEAL